MADVEIKKRGRGAPKKSQRFTFALMRSLKDAYGTDLEGMAKCADALVEIALNTEHPQQLKALTEIRDTIQGKPKQAIVGGDEDDNPIQITDARDFKLLGRYGINDED